MKLSDKVFEDFLATLTEERVAELAESASQFTKDNPISTNSSDLGNHIAVISNLLTINLLNEYHQWLMKDLD